MSSYKKRERRQVSFNTEDAIELDLLLFTDRDDINFSGLVKNLLFAYKMGQLQPQDSANSPLTPQAPVRPVKKKSTPEPSGASQIRASGMPFDF